MNLTDVFSPLYHYGNLCIAIMKLDMRSTNGIMPKRPFGCLRIWKYINNAKCARYLWCLSTEIVIWYRMIHLDIFRVWHTFIRRIIVCAFFCSLRKHIISWYFVTYISKVGHCDLSSFDYERFNSYILTQNRYVRFTFVSVYSKRMQLFYSNILLQ